MSVVPLSSGTSTLLTRAMYCRARRSFGRQEPPKAKPGRRYAGEMLSLWSSQKTSITSRESTPCGARTRPISLAKDTLVAWKALQAYFSASAVATLDVMDVLVEKREELAQVLPGAVVGRANDDEGRGEEVLDAAPFAQELRAHCRFPLTNPAGGSWEDRVDDRAPVPGGTVLRMTTEWNPLAGGAHTAIAARRSPSARAMKVRSVFPSAVDGVPTHTSEMSAFSMAT